MNKTKKIALSLVSVGLIALPFIAFAQPTVTIGSVGDLITKIKSLMWLVFGGIAVIMFVIAGVLFVTAGGAPEKIATARSAFIWGVVGVVVAIVAYSITAMVAAFLG